MRKIQGILTYTGKDYYPSCEWHRCIDKDDIVQALSLQTRFNGLLEKPYYTAQHVLLCQEFYNHYIRDTLELSEVEKQSTEIHILHHDDTEAYVGDMPAPMKRLVPQFSHLEDVIWKDQIVPYWENYYGGIIINDYSHHEVVASVDRFALWIEREYLIQRKIGSPSGLWHESIEQHPYIEVFKSQEPSVRMSWLLSKNFKSEDLQIELRLAYERIKRDVKKHF